MTTSATQINDMLLSGLNSALQAFDQRQQRMAEIEAMRYDQQLDQWRGFAAALQRHSADILTGYQKTVDMLKSAATENDQLKEDNQRLKKKQAEYSDYVVTLIRHISDLN